MCGEDFFFFRDEALNFEVHALHVVCHSVISSFFRDGLIFWIFNEKKEKSAPSSFAWHHSKNNLDHSPSLSLIHI